MRKPSFLLIFLMSFILTTSFYITAYADTVYENIQELFTAWSTDGYPDNVGGVYSQNGGEELVVMLVNDDEAGRNEILELLTDDSTVSFTTAKYSHNQLMEINDKVVENMNQKSHIYTCGIDDKQNVLCIGVDQEVYDKLKEEYTNLYGDMVNVYVSSPVYPISAEVGSKKIKPYQYFTITLGVLIIVGTIVFVTLLHHRQLFIKIIMMKNKFN